MTDERWIVIPNWRRFQHYKDRNPKWIKVYTELMSDPNFLGLTYAQRGLLITIWLEYANSHAKVTIEPGKDTPRTFQRVRKSQLEALNRAGFIEFSASRPLAGRYQNAMPELLRNSNSGDARASAPGAAPPREQLLADARQLAENWNGPASDVFDERLDELEARYHDRLRTLEREDLWDVAFDRSRG